MPVPKSTKRQQTAQINIRCLPDQKADLERKAHHAQRELQKSHPGARLGVGPWLLQLGLSAPNGETKKGGQKP